MRATVAAGCATAFVIAGCGQSSDKSADDVAPRPNCDRASPTLLNAIRTGLQVDGGGTLRRGFIVRSKDFSKVFMVAAEIDGPELEGSGDIGVWATNSPSANGLIFAVDGLAKQFSDWGDGDTTDAAIESSADGVDEAKRCAEG